MYDKSKFRTASSIILYNYSALNKKAGIFHCNGQGWAIFFGHVGRLKFFFFNFEKQITENYIIT